MNFVKITAYMNVLYMYDKVTKSLDQGTFFQ